MNQFTDECYYAATAAAADYEPCFSVKHDYDGDYFGQPPADPYYGCDAATAAGYCDYGYDTAVAFNGSWSSSHQEYPPFDGQQQHHHAQPLIPYACGWTPPDDDRPPPPPPQQSLQQPSPHELPPLSSLPAVVPEPTDFRADDGQVAFHHVHLQNQRDDAAAEQTTADPFSEFNDRSNSIWKLLCFFAPPHLREMYLGLILIFNLFSRYVLFTHVQYSL